MFPLINKERTCAQLKGVVLDVNLNSAAQKLAIEIIELDLRTDYPNFSKLDLMTVDARVSSTEWKGARGAGNLEQVIQYSKFLYDTNVPTVVIQDLMCDKDQTNKKTLLNPLFTSVGIGFAKGNNNDTRMNTKSVYVLIFGTDSSVKAQDILPPKDGSCTNWSLPGACPVLAPVPAPPK